MHMKATMWYRYTTAKMAKTKKTGNIQYWPRYGEVKPLRTAEENVDLSSHFGKPFGNPLDSL